MAYAVMNYTTALSQTGSRRKLASAVNSGELFKVSYGVYATCRVANPWHVAMTRWPSAIITMYSAFDYYGLSDYIPQRTHLATLRNGTRISDDQFKQYFSHPSYFEAGLETVMVEGQPVRSYSQERMLVELVRNYNLLPFDYYKEVIGAFRERIYQLDFFVVEEYLNLFRGANRLFDKIQLEVM